MGAAQYEAKCVHDAIEHYGLGKLFERVSRGIVRCDEYDACKGSLDADAHAADEAIELLLHDRGLDWDLTDGWETWSVSAWLVDQSVEQVKALLAMSDGDIEGLADSERVVLYGFDAWREASELAVLEAAD